ncbi:MAG: S24 family peptidase [Proteobacteria bacterium]|nr:S24 family peptidase [Pseudomonadota bacterium]
MAVKHARLVQDAVAQGLYLSIPLLKDAVAAGPPTEVDEQDIEGWVLIYADRHWLRGDPVNYTCVRVQGRSMYPVLDHGDIVAIDHQCVPLDLDELKRLNGKMVAFRVEGGVTIKWFKYIEDKELVVGIPENRNEVDHLVALRGDQINEGIVGCIRWWWSKIG